jgi:hypothetical protein
LQSVSPTLSERLGSSEVMSPILMNVAQAELPITIVNVLNNVT